MKKLLLAALILAAFAGCKKDKESSIDSTKVYFYTNAHLYVNCGPFDVNVYVDDKLCGTLRLSATEEFNPCEKGEDEFFHEDEVEKGEDGLFHEVEVEKIEDGFFLEVEVEKNREHTYKAVSECGTSKELKGEFCFSDDECHSVFLDFYVGMDFSD